MPETGCLHELVAELVLDSRVRWRLYERIPPRVTTHSDLSVYQGDELPRREVKKVHGWQGGGGPVESLSSARKAPLMPDAHRLRYGLSFRDFCHR